MDFTKLDEIYDSLKRNVEKFSEKTKTMEEIEKNDKITQDELDEYTVEATSFTILCAKKIEDLTTELQEIIKKM